MVREIIQIHNHSRMKQYLAISDEIVISFYPLLQFSLTTTSFFQLSLLVSLFLPRSSLFFNGVFFHICIYARESTKTNFHFIMNCKLCCRRKNSSTQCTSMHRGNFNDWKTCECIRRTIRKFSIFSKCLLAKLMKMQGCFFLCLKNQRVIETTGMRE